MWVGGSVGWAGVGHSIVERKGKLGHGGLCAGCGGCVRGLQVAVEMRRMRIAVVLRGTGGSIEHCCSAGPGCRSDVQ